MSKTKKSLYLAGAAVTVISVTVLFFFWLHGTHPEAWIKVRPFLQALGILASGAAVLALILITSLSNPYRK